MQFHALIPRFVSQSEYAFSFSYPILRKMGSVLVNVWLLGGRGLLYSNIFWRKGQRKKGDSNKLMFLFYFLNLGLLSALC